MAAMIVMGAIAAGSAIYGAHKSSSAAKKASETQADSAQAALDQQRAMYESTRGDLAPYREAGGQGLTSLTGLLTAGPGEFTTSPGYQFRLDEGRKALEKSAAARGTLLTGGTLKGMERYAQGVASDEYQRFLDRYNTRVGQWGSLAGMGQNAAAQQGASNTAFGNAASGLLTDQGNVRAAGTVGSANAWNGAISQASNLAQQYYLSRLLYGGGGGGSQPPPGTTPAFGGPGGEFVP